MHIIKLDNVGFSYDGKAFVLKDITFMAAAGERIGIIGANGTGKSTLFKIMMGLLTAEGSIEIGGFKLNRKNLAEIRKKTGLVLQDSDNQLFMPTLFDDMMFGPMNYGKSAEESEACVNRALSQLEIEHLKDRGVGRMSGGEKKLASIAVIMAMEPEIILMDEPSTGLDPYNRRRLINNLNAMTQTLLIASHDLDMILETCERVILIDEGRIIADGPAPVILKDEKLLTERHLELPLCFQTCMPYNK